jgi:hypothetical protein
MKKINKWSSFLFVLFLTSGLNVLGFAQTFQTSDFAGNWYAYSIEVDPTPPGAVYWFWGNTNVNESGDVSGTFYGPDGLGVAVSGGQITLDYKGVVSGYFSASGSTSSIVHGKMDPSKTKGTGVTIGSDGTMDLLTFIKGGGTFTSSDIQGGWYSYVMAIDATGLVYWAYGLLNVDGSGKASGNFTAPNGTIVSVDGSIGLNPDGILSGSATLLADGDSSTQTLVHGKLDQSKTSGAFVSIDLDDGSMNIAYLVKSGGVFKQSDTAGNWYVYTMNIDPTIPAVYWAYGKVGIDALGNMKGSYIGPLPPIVKVTSTLQMDNEGLSTGTFNFDTGDSGIVPSIKLDQGKTSMTGVGIITSGSSTGAMSILQFIKESNIAMPWVPLLLLDE